MRHLTVVLTFAAALVMGACSGSEMLTAPNGDGSSSAALQSGTDPSSNNVKVRLYDGTDPCSNC